MGTDGSHYRRVLLKMSGQALQGPAGLGIDPPTVDYVASQLSLIHDLGVELGVAVGGGNFLRGEQLAEMSGMDRATADYMGMLGTVMNALALKGALQLLNVDTRVQSAISMVQVAESYIRTAAIEHLENRRVVIFAAGTGNPFFSVDTAGALRALEIGAEVLLMAKNGVDGVYTADPVRDPHAQRYDRLTFMDALSQGLGVMDSTALTLCMDNKLPIIVFDLMNPENLPRILRGEQVGTLVA